VQVHNFTPADYIDTFINVNGTAGVTPYDRPSVGFSATPVGMGQWWAGGPVTDPYSFYAGWTFGSGSIDIEYQEYDWVGDGQWNFLPGPGW
jgi:hypothetical protein